MLRDVETDCADILAAADLGLELGQQPVLRPAAQGGWAGRVLPSDGRRRRTPAGTWGCLHLDVQVHVSAPRDSYREAKLLADSVFSALWLVRTDSYAQILPDGAAANYLGQDDVRPAPVQLDRDLRPGRQRLRREPSIPRSPNDESMSVTTLDLSAGIRFADGSPMAAAPVIPDVSGLLSKSGGTMTGPLVFSGVASGSNAIEIPAGARLKFGSGAGAYLYTDGSFNVFSGSNLIAGSSLYTSGGMVAVDGSNKTLKFASTINDGASAVGFIFDKELSALTTAGAKLVSVRNCRSGEGVLRQGWRASHHWRSCQRHQHSAEQPNRPRGRKVLLHRRQQRRLQSHAVQPGWYSFDRGCHCVRLEPTGLPPRSRELVRREQHHGQREGIAG